MLIVSSLADALLSRLTGRPVRIRLNREESVRLHPKRHPMTLHYTVGCDRDGHLTALRARIVGDKGAFASVGTKVLERAAGHAAGPYKVPAVDIESLAVYTNNPPCGAMRGFGANQAHFALEGCIDLLAQKAGLELIQKDLVALMGELACAEADAARYAASKFQKIGAAELARVTIWIGEIQWALRQRLPYHLTGAHVTLISNLAQLQQSLFLDHDGCAFHG